MPDNRSVCGYCGEVRLEPDDACACERGDVTEPTIIQRGRPPKRIKARVIRASEKK